MQFFRHAAFRKVSRLAILAGWGVFALILNHLFPSRIHAPLTTYADVALLVFMFLVAIDNEKRISLASSLTGYTTILLWALFGSHVYVSFEPSSSGALSVLGAILIGAMAVPATIINFSLTVKNKEKKYRKEFHMTKSNTEDFVSNEIKSKTPYHAEL